MKRLLILFCFSILWLSCGQSSAALSVGRDTVSASSSAEQAIFENDTVYEPGGGTAKGESKPVAATVVHKMNVIKRTFDYGEQIGLAMGMMAFITVMMFTSQSLNP